MSESRLNLGCGLNKKDGYINVDINPKLGVDVVADVLKGLPFEDGTFDEVLCEHVLEHLWLPNEDVTGMEKGCERALKEIHRVLVTGGRAIIEVPNHLGEGAVRKTNSHLVSLRSWRITFVRLGFEVVKVNGMGGTWVQVCYPFWWIMSKLHPWFANSWRFELRRTAFCYAEDRRT